MSARVCSIYAPSRRIESCLEIMGLFYVGLTLLSTKGNDDETKEGLGSNTHDLSVECFIPFSSC